MCHYLFKHAVQIQIVPRQQRQRNLVDVRQRLRHKMDSSLPKQRLDVAVDWMNLNQMTMRLMMRRLDLYLGNQYCCRGFDWLRHLMSWETKWSTRRMKVMIEGLLMNQMILSLWYCLRLVNACLIDCKILLLRVINLN